MPRTIKASGSAGKTSKVILYVMALALNLAACGKETENPVVQEGKAFPICPYTDVVYNSQQLIDIAVDDLIKRIPRCGRQYSSVKEFYSFSIKRRSPRLAAPPVRPPDMGRGNGSNPRPETARQAWRLCVWHNPFRYFHGSSKTQRCSPRKEGKAGRNSWSCNPAGVARPPPPIVS